MAAVSPPYKPKPDHRDGSSEKSQWIIPVASEHATFADAISNGWTLPANDSAWGLHFDSGVSAPLGTSAASKGEQRALHVAYFILARVSHGYPSDPTRRVREIPPKHILKSWLDAGHFRPQVIRKMGRGQACKP